MYGFTGLGFMAANLVLARLLEPTTYATIALAVAILGLAVPLGPLGVDGVVNRLLLEPSWALVGVAAGSSLAVGALSALGSSIAYRFTAPLGFLLFLGIAAGGCGMVAAAVYQKRQRLMVAILLTQNGNLSLMAAALLMAAFKWDSPVIPIGVMAAGYAGSAILGWLSLRPGSRNGSLPMRLVWRDALHYAGVSGSGLLLLQLERVLVPGFLSLVDLATFGVVAAVVISPFRMLQMGASFAILPRLRAAGSLRERQGLLRREFTQVGVISALGVLGVLVLAPSVLDALLGAKYDFSMALIVAAATAGVVRVLGGFSRGAASALCTTRELARFNLLGWLTVVVAVAGAAVGAHWGLAGLVYGTSVGWVLWAAGAALLVQRHLRVATAGIPIAPVGDGTEAGGPPA